MPIAECGREAPGNLHRSFSSESCCCMTKRNYFEKSRLPNRDRKAEGERERKRGSEEQKKRRRERERLREGERETEREGGKEERWKEMSIFQSFREDMTVKGSDQSQEPMESQMHSQYIIHHRSHHNIYLITVALHQKI